MLLRFLQRNATGFSGIARYELYWRTCKPLTSKALGLSEGTERDACDRISRPVPGWCVGRLLTTLGYALK